MKKTILIGRTGSGKTTFTQAINEKETKYKKTQAIETNNNIIDTPGEYIENRRFYNALITTSFDCDVIALVQDSTDEESVFPPGFAAMFNNSVIGIITKIDSQHKNLSYAKDCLLDAGAERIFQISSLNGSGIKEIKEFLEFNDK